MPKLGGLPSRLSDAVEAYVNERASDRPVSLKRLVIATSYLMPELALSEKEISDLIASKLVMLGCNINFDMNEESPRRTQETRPAKARLQAPFHHGATRPLRQAQQVPQREQRVFNRREPR